MGVLEFQDAEAAKFQENIDQPSLNPELQAKVEEALKQQSSATETETPFAPLTKS